MSWHQVYEPQISTFSCTYRVNRTWQVVGLGMRQRAGLGSDVSFIVTGLNRTTIDDHHEIGMPRNRRRSELFKAQECQWAWSRCGFNVSAHDRVLVRYRRPSLPCLNMLFDWEVRCLGLA